MSDQVDPSTPELLKAAVTIIAKKFDVEQEAAMQIVLDELKAIDRVTEQSILTTERWMWQMRQNKRMFENMNAAFEASHKPKVDGWREKARSWYKEIV